LEPLILALGLKHPVSEQHSRRVGTLTGLLVKAMGLGNEESRLIVRAAFLHDIGNIGIPDSLLNTPATLTSLELEHMETHCRLGYELVNKVPLMTVEPEIILNHHEWFDGSGYPNKKTGDSIPLGSRICAVADALDAMVSDRPYRKAR